MATAAIKYHGDETQYAALIEAKKAEDRRYAAEKRQLDAQLQAQQLADLNTLRARYASYISGTVSTTVNGFSRMLAGTMSFKQFGMSVFASIAQQAEQQVAKMATDWIVKHVLMGAAGKLLGEGQATGAASGAAATVAASKAAVVALAGQAGAAGVASMAAAPFPLDMDAPAFGAEMAAAAMSMGTFARGANFLPTDMIAQIHAGERIVPAADNRQMMELMARGAGQGPAGDQNFHLHYNPQISGQASFADQIAAHESNIIDIMRNAARRGVRFS